MKKYRKNENIFVQDFLENCYALNLESGEAYDLNETGKEILEKIEDNEMNAVEILKAFGGDESYTEDLRVLEQFLVELETVEVILASE